MTSLVETRATRLMTVMVLCVIGRKPGVELEIRASDDGK